MFLNLNDLNLEIVNKDDWEIQLNTIADFQLWISLSYAATS
jgi:hypothetical protein